ncbi:isochorismatase family protein [Streptomyces sp. NBC_01023]|uniref:isochorismatase family protein n=1 Tax=Streptomyces sp. NBC_01023 TaxID=2903724 RepID=UPI0038644ED3|nr:isochorismatase family protein [Streptomyces sp. NBC_01023]
MPPASVLLVIDMQNSTVAIAHRAAETVTVIAGLRERALAASAPVVMIQDQGEGMEPGTDGWKMAPELLPNSGELVVHKTSPDSFLGTGLDAALKAVGATEVVVTGFATEMCVDTTARQALSHGYDVVLVADGHTTSIRPESESESESDSRAFAPPDRSIAHHNEIFRNIRFPGRRVRVLPAAEVEFSWTP